MKKLFSAVFILVLISHQAWADKLITKTIAVQYVDANLLVQALKPLLHDNETISVFDNKIILSVSSDTLTKIRPIIHDLDKPKAMLLVKIHQDSENWLDQGYQKADVYSTSSQTLQKDNQSVKVLSGTSAYVNTAENYPVIQWTGVSLFYGGGVAYQRQQSNKGFYIQPTLQGTQVKLFIKRQYGQQNRVNQQDDSNSSVESTMMVPLNQWVKLSETSSAEGHDNGDAYVFQASGGVDYKGALYIKIEKLRQ